MINKEDFLRNIPQVEKILQLKDIKKYTLILSRGIILKIIKEEIFSFRQEYIEKQNVKIDDLINSIIERCRIKRMEKIQRVINGTGVVIHTNLGRSPTSKDTLVRFSEELSGYCNLEIYLPTGKRGKRGGFAEELICDLTSGEDALIVNNNASSLFLILNEFGKGKDVIISRGELIQIGGGFRIPDIMNQSGANLIEVGTTNITDLEDYRDSFTDNTSMILSVHQSNYKIEGFSRNPSLKDLSTLKNHSVMLVRDLGSGNVVNGYGLPQDFEPTVSFELSQGADLVCFSGDKLLGGCQAGIITGKKDFIAMLRKNPLMRMIRVDKLTYYLLQETLIHYMNGEIKKIPLWNIVLQDINTIRKRVNKLFRRIQFDDKKEIFRRIPLMSTYGGGALPSIQMESVGLQIDLSKKREGTGTYKSMSPDEISRKFISREVPILGYIIHDRFTLDFRTIFDDDLIELAKAVNSLVQSN